MAWLLTGLLGHPGNVRLYHGIIGGIAMWFGFVLTTLPVNYAFAMRGLRLTLIDAGHWLAVLVVVGAIVGAFGL